MVHRKISAVVIIIILVLIVLLVQSYLSFNKEMETVRQELSANSQVIHTASGPIEYADVGDGYPVLVVHGAGGGYDQGLLLSEIFLNGDYRVIAPSRFGFLETPMTENASFAAQADMFADLLDELNVSKVAIIGISAGGPSTMEFALRYPDRTSAMVLVSPMVHKEKPMNTMSKIIHYGLFRSDFLFWMWAKNFESALTSFLGVPPEIQNELTKDEQTWLSDTFIPSLHPISQRQAGMINDAIQFTMIDYHLDNITVPALVIYAKDDTLVNPSHGEYAAKNIPNASVFSLERGGHLLMGQHRSVRLKIGTFLESNN